ncbi:MAG: cell division protein SepF [Drouetiella hepatica Uher 2000/2452]|jgi:cell division inhibitor SepF|uniref:Cell division protein SepF n=1 Tax=Drouetiella hepatica Uher 2000/2452 TaxID=904376 RepID=A0A951UQ13_9CYAN|nr:cell division protein SepF [Drouetiella hepatica Uher 2000/2452]
MSFFQRLRDVLGIDEEYEEYEDDLEDPQALDEQEGSGSERRSRYGSGSPANGSSKVIGLPGSGQMEVVMMQPRSFQEVPQAVNALRERKSVILDLTLMDAQQAQRSADYVAGGAYAIDGHQRHLGACVFLFTPSFVQISSYSGAEPTVEQPTAMGLPIEPPTGSPTGSPTLTTKPPTGIPPIFNRTGLRTNLQTEF